MSKLSEVMGVPEAKVTAKLLEIAGYHGGSIFETSPGKLPAGEDVIEILRASRAHETWRNGLDDRLKFRVHTAKEVSTHMQASLESERKKFVAQLFAGIDDVKRVFETPRLGHAAYDLKLGEAVLISRGSALALLATPAEWDEYCTNAQPKFVTNGATNHALVLTDEAAADLTAEGDPLCSKFHGLCSDHTRRNNGVNVTLAYIAALHHWNTASVGGVADGEGKLTQDKNIVRLVAELEMGGGATEAQKAIWYKPGTVSMLKRDSMGALTFKV